jgi:hypothetical protein
MEGAKMTTLYYRQTQNECAGAAVLHALYDPDDITPIELADAAALIDQFPTSNSKDGGTSIEACLGVAHKMGLCPAYANIEPLPKRVLEHLATGGRVCLSIDSQARNPVTGAPMGHAVCITAGDDYGVAVYDPAHGEKYAWTWTRINAEASKAGRGYWLVDTDTAGVVKRSISRRRVPLSTIAAAIILVSIICYALL